MGKLGLIEGGGQTNYLSLKAGDKKRIRIILDKDHPIQATWWHSIKEDKEIGRKYHQWLCPGQKFCVLCEKNAFAVKASPTGKLDNKDKPFPFAKKYIVNCWSYNENKLKAFSFGGRVLDALAAQEKGLGKDIDQFDICLTREGSGAYDTKYGVIALPDDKDTVDTAKVTALDLKAILAESARSDEDLENILSGTFDAKFKKSSEALEAGEQTLEIEAPKPPKRTFFLRGNTQSYSGSLNSLGWYYVEDHWELPDSNQVINQAWEPLAMVRSIIQTDKAVKLTVKEAVAHDQD